MSEQTPQKNQAEKDNESLVASFHRVKSLISDDQKLITVRPEMPVSEALNIMQRNHFSQLPVVAGDAVLGVFSYRSFSAKALARQKGTKQSLGDLPVEDFLEQVEYTHADDDWNRVLRYLNQEDAFFVGHSNNLDGMVTTMDMLGYFQEIANPFIMIAEIELSLRQIIQTCIKTKALPEAIRKSLKTAYSTNAIPTDLKQMTFDNYVQIISNGENWSHFKQMFGDQERARKQTNQKLKQLGEWRNTIFHFRRRLEQWELDTLADHREWLHRRVRAFEGRRRKGETEGTGKRKSKARKTNLQRVVEESDPVAAEFFDEMLKLASERKCKVYWGTGGFSIRKQLPHRIASFAYGYPPQKFEFYFKNLDLSEEEEYRWRQDLLSSGVLSEAGEHTLRASITEDNVSILRELYSHILDKVEAYADD